MIDVVIAILATYGVSTLVADYDGPRDIFIRLRKRSKFFECAVCLSPWVAVIPALLIGLSFVEYIAVVGGTIIIARNV